MTDCHHPSINFRNGFGTTSMLFMVDGHCASCGAPMLFSEGFAISPDGRRLQIPFSLGQSDLATLLPKPASAGVAIGQRRYLN